MNQRVAGSTRVRLHGFAFVAVVAAGWWLRAWPLMRDGALTYPSDYDEGVYFAASSMLAKGIAPYRSFVFAHPPGILLFHLPASWLAAAGHPAAAFAVSRWIATLVGVASIVLVGAIARRIWGPWAGVLAAAIYATYPEAVFVERGPYLEPALNLTCLAVAYCLVRLFESPGPLGAERRWVAAGVAAAAAVAIKATGAIVVVAALAMIVAIPRAARRAALVRFGGGLAGGVVALIGPFIAVAPRSFVRDVIGFQLWRPPDGVPRSHRLPYMIEVLQLRHAPNITFAHVVGISRFLITPAATVGIVVAFLILRRRPATPEVALARFALVFGGLTVIAFVTATSYYPQYNAFVAVPETLLATLGGVRLVKWFGATKSIAIGALALAVVLAGHAALVQGRAAPFPRSALAAQVRTRVTPQQCLYAFEPAWGLLANRLPPSGDHRPVIVDSYGAMLLPAVDRGRRTFVSVGPAFEDPRSQVTIQRLLTHCDAVVYDGRGPAELSDESETWFAAHFTKVWTDPKGTGIDLWLRNK